MSVMSCEQPRVPITAPRASRTGMRLAVNQRTRPPRSGTRSIFATSGRPVAITSCSSASAAAACSGAKKSASLFPTASAGSSRPSTAACAWLMRMNRESASFRYTGSGSRSSSAVHAPAGAASSGAAAARTPGDARRPQRRGTAQRGGLPLELATRAQQLDVRPHGRRELIEQFDFVGAPAARREVEHGERTDDVAVGGDERTGGAGGDAQLGHGGVVAQALVGARVAHGERVAEADERAAEGMR